MLINATMQLQIALRLQMSTGFSLTILQKGDVHADQAHESLSSAHTS